MKILSLLLASLISLSQNTQNLVIIGDSLTEGYGVESSQSYPAVLENKIKTSGKNWKVVNHGISGSTSASAASRVRWVLKNPPKIVILALGANDGLRAVKPEATKKNLEDAIELLQKNNIKVFLSAMKVPPNYKGGSYTEKFEALYGDIAKKRNVPLIPFILDGVAGRPELNLPDGIHPNAKGHEIVAENIYKSIADSL